MRRFAAVAPAGGRSFAAGVCAEGLFSPGFLRRTVLAAGRAVFAATGFRSPAPASVGSRRRFRTGRPPPGLRACRDACSGFDAPRSVHRGPCIGAMPAGSCVGRFASTLPHGTAPPRTSCVPGCVFRIRCPEVRASGRVHRGPCIGAMPAGSCVGRFASTLPHGTAPPRTSCVPGCVFRIRCPARSVNRGPCIGGRAVQPVFRGRAVRIGCLPPRCGGGMRRSAPSLSDAGRDRSMTRETAETQRTERAVARNGRIRFGDGAVRFAVGRMGPAGRSAVSTGGGVRTAGQPVRRAEGRIRSGNGKTRTRHGAAPGASRSGVRVRQTSGGGRRTSVSPTGKTERKRIWGRAAGAWS